MSEDGRYQAREVIPGPITSVTVGRAVPMMGQLTPAGFNGWPHAPHLTFEQRSLATLEQILLAAKETNVILGTLVAQRTEDAVVAKGKKK